jgi:hypothetical protein
MLVVVEPARAVERRPRAHLDGHGSVDDQLVRGDLLPVDGYTARGRRYLPPGAEVNALPHVGVQSYDERAAARYVLCIRKEVLAMFANRQTPPGVAL